MGRTEVKLTCTFPPILYFFFYVWLYNFLPPGIHSFCLFTSITNKNCSLQKKPDGEIFDWRDAQPVTFPHLYVSQRRMKQTINLKIQRLSKSTCDDTVVSEAASSMLKFEKSPAREEHSSSPQIDGGGDASAVDDPSVSSPSCSRFQYMIPAISVRIIFWFTYHSITLVSELQNKNVTARSSTKFMSCMKLLLPLW